MAKQGKSTGMIKWDEQLAKEAELAAAQEAKVGGGKFISLKGGIMTFDGAQLPNNQLACVIVDSLFENVMYEGAYDPDNMSPPACFAFGRDEKSLAPHEVVVEANQAVCSDCASCPNNQWGSAEKGKGKACSNRRRLALIAAGSFDSQGRFIPDLDETVMAEAQLAFMKLSPTNTKGWAGYVHQLAQVAKRPPHGVITKIRVVPDPKTQFRVIFEMVENVSNELMGIIMKRREEAQGAIEMPYDLTPAPAPEPPQRRQPARPVAKPMGRQQAAPPARGKKY